MRISGFEIRDIWHPSDETFIRAKVDVHFSNNSFDGDMPVGPAITIVPFIKHDGTATYEKVEAELLAEARRILTRAIQEIDGKAPSAIRQAVELSNQEEDARRRAAIDDALAVEMQNLQET